MEELKETLKRRIDFINHNSTFENYITLESDFISFIFQNDYLNEAIENLILKNKINPIWFKRVYANYTITQVITSRSFNEKSILDMDEVKIPLFINEGTEKETEYLYDDPENIPAYTSLYFKQYKNSLGVKFKLQELLKNLEKNLKKDKTEKMLDALQIEFDKKEYEENKFNLNKFNQDILSEMFNLKPKEKDFMVSFDPDNSKILCNNKEIKITKNKDIYYIIKFIFERDNIHEECFYDEIIDSLDNSKDLRDKNIYDNLFRFKIRLEKNELSDLFIINSHSILLNKKYILKN